MEFIIKQKKKFIMKKNNFKMSTRSAIIIMFTVLFCSFTTNFYAQSDRKYNRTMEKDYKKSIKELKKTGWTVSGTSLSLDAALMKHQRMLNSDTQNCELVAEVSMCYSSCESHGLNKAMNKYAQNAGSYIRGRITSDMFNNSSAETLEEFDKFYAAYERLVQAEVKGELEFSFAIEKPNGAGKSYRAYYIVNEEKAAKARLRAMQRAFEETKVAQQYAKQVSDFVQEAFE